MQNLIERYIHDVVRRLPEQEQDEVGKELRSNICDMIPEDAGIDTIRAALTELGSPALLAEQYRQNPRCLISAAFYDDYLSALKWVLPLVGGILMIVGLLQGAADAITNEITEFPYFFKNVIGSGISSGISGAIQALVWVTLGFAITDRVNKKTNSLDRWNIDDLPENIPNSKNVIPLLDSIVELLVIVFFSTVCVLLCVGRIPLPLVLHGGTVQVKQLFSDSFLTACVPVIIIGGALGILESITKIIKRRWTPLVCSTIIISKLTQTGLILHLCSRQDVFSLDFITFAQSQGWLWFNGVSVFKNSLIMLIVAIIIISSLAECGFAIYRTIRTTKSNELPLP